MTKVRWALFPIALWVVTRLSLLLAGYLSMSISGEMHVNWASAALKPYPALDALCRWDCGWYEKIATFGYREVVELNVWPGLPLLARGLGAGSGMSIGMALLVISNLAGLGAYLVLYRLFTRIDGEAAARWALVLFAAFPFAFFHAAGYPETLMILASAGAVSLAMSGRHLLAGLVLGLGLLVRHLTVLAGGALLAAQIRERGWRGLFRSPSVLGLFVPGLVAALYMLFIWKRWGDPFAFLKARDMWSPTARWSIFGVLKVAHVWPHVVAQAPFALIPTIGTVMLLGNGRYAELASAVIPLMVMIWVIGTFGLGRYAASCWPAYLPLGRWLERRPGWQAPVIVVLALAQGCFFYMFSHHYEIQ